MVKGSSPGVESLFPAVEGLTPGVERNPVGACSILGQIIPVPGQGGQQRRLLLINSLDVTDSQGKYIAVDPVKSAQGRGFDWRSHG